MQTLTTIFRTKVEAKVAVKSGVVLHIVRDGVVLDQASGEPWLVTCQLGHYKAWTGNCRVQDGKVVRIT